jgi:hypothetical protein
MWLCRFRKEVRTMAGWKKVWKAERQQLTKVVQSRPSWAFWFKDNELTPVNVYREDNE